MSAVSGALSSAFGVLFSAREGEIASKRAVQQGNNDAGLMGSDISRDKVLSFGKMADSDGISGPWIYERAFAVGGKVGS